MGAVSLVEFLALDQDERLGLGCLGLLRVALLCPLLPIELSDWRRKDSLCQGLHEAPFDDVLAELPVESGVKVGELGLESVLSDLEHQSQVAEQAVACCLLRIEPEVLERVEEIEELQLCLVPLIEPAGFDLLESEATCS